MQVIDNTAKTWFINLGAYRLPHPFREGVFFEPGVKCLVDEDDWMRTQPTLVETTVEEDTSDRQLEPTKPGNPQFDKEADDAVAKAAAEKFVSDKAARNKTKAPPAEPVEAK